MAQFLLARCFLVFLPSTSGPNLFFLKVTQFSPATVLQCLQVVLVRRLDVLHAARLVPIPFRSCARPCGDNDFGNDPTRRTTDSCLGNGLPFLSLSPCHPCHCPHYRLSFPSLFLPFLFLFLSKPFPAKDLFPRKRSIWQTSPPLLTSHPSLYHGSLPPHHTCSPISS